MKAFSAEEFEEFLRDPDLGTRLRSAWAAGELQSRTRKADDDLMSRFLADKVAAIFSEHGGKVILEVSDWSIFPSYDNRKIFVGYRRLLGESRPLIEARFHLFDEHEVEDYRNLFNLGLMFLYDIRMTNLKTGVCVSIDHHDGFDFIFPPTWQAAMIDFFDGRPALWPSD